MEIACSNSRLLLLKERLKRKHAHDIDKEVQATVDQETIAVNTVAPIEELQKRSHVQEVQCTHSQNTEHGAWNDGHECGHA